MYNILGKKLVNIISASSLPDKEERAYCVTVVMKILLVCLDVQVGWPIYNCLVIFHAAYLFYVK